MGMTPVNSNVADRSCDEPVSSNCVQSQVPAAPCLQLCANPTQTQVDFAQNQAICSLLSLTDLSGIDLGCLYESTLITWTCPVGQTFLPDATAPNGVGYCQACPTPTTCYITTNTPVQTSTPNPVPPPTTLKGILELMISKIPCCDPCSLNASGGVNPGS